MTSAATQQSRVAGSTFKSLWPIREKVLVPKRKAAAPAGPCSLCLWVDWGGDSTKGATGICVSLSKEAGGGDGVPTGAAERLAAIFTFHLQPLSHSCVLPYLNFCGGSAFPFPELHSLPVHLSLRSRGGESPPFPPRGPVLSLHRDDIRLLAGWIPLPLPCANLCALPLRRSALKKSEDAHVRDGREDMEVLRLFAASLFTLRRLIGSRGVLPPPGAVLLAPTWG